MQRHSFADVQEKSNDFLINTMCENRNLCVLYSHIILCGISLQFSKSFKNNIERAALYCNHLHIKYEICDTLCDLHVGVFHQNAQIVSNNEASNRTRILQYFMQHVVFLWNRQIYSKISGVPMLCLSPSWLSIHTPCYALMFPVHSLGKALPDICLIQVGVWALK